MKRKSLVKIVSTVVLISAITFAVMTISRHNSTNKVTKSSNRVSQSQLIKHITYGMVNGNGTNEKIYINVNGELQQYNVKSSYIGTNIQVIATDKAITVTNYKSIKILSTKVINGVSSADANQCEALITAYNKMIRR